MKRIIALLACALLIMGFASFAAASPPTVGQMATDTIEIATTAPTTYDTVINIGTRTDTAINLSTYNVMMTAKLRAATTLSDMTTVALKTDYIGTTTATYDTGQTMILDTGQIATMFYDTGQTIAMKTDYIGTDTATYDTGQTMILDTGQTIAMKTDTGQIETAIIAIYDTSQTTALTPHARDVIQI